MPFWGSNRFRDNLDKVIPEGTPDRIKQGSYELSLGREAYLSGDGGKKTLSDDDIVLIEPGQTALLLALEYIKIPPDAIGFISLKSSAKMPGLINVSGFHVDPGYEGKLVFTVFNAGTTQQCFRCGEPLFLLWIADMAESDDPYNGPRKSQQTLPTKVIGQLGARGTSPNALERRISDLEKARGHIHAAWIAIAIGIIVLVIQGFPFERVGAKIGDLFFAAPPVTPTTNVPS